MTVNDKDGPAKKTGSHGSPDSEPFGFRIKSAVRRELELIAEYDGKLNASELVRSWTSEKVTEFRNDKLFVAWCKKNHPQAAKPDAEQAQLA